MSTLRTLSNLESIYNNFFGEYEDLKTFKNLKSEIKDNKLYLELDMPGATKEDIVLETDNDLIIVKGVGGRYDKFQSKIRINREYNIESIEAVLKDGVLKVAISKGTNEKRNRIQIK